ncbi:MAG: helix-turn-helix transcriptional regulator [Steroidobacteraceae bacterium]
MRHYLAESEGHGYWEYFRPADHLLLSVTDAAYRQTQWIEIPQARVLKLRLLVAGQLLGPRHEALLHERQAHLHLSSGLNTEGYFLTAGETKLIILHCDLEFLQGTLGLSSIKLPPPVDTIANISLSSTHPIGFSAEVFHLAQRILDSRHGMPSDLRSSYLKSMATTILCEVFAELTHRDVARRSACRLQARDVNQVYEARDYLAQHFVAPPTISQLARMVGTNQTKLKAGFKLVFGLTLYQYILERRMELASELLLTRDYNVTEIAYRVGYEYPANFTYAFKKHFGRLPRAWKKQH